MHNLGTIKQNQVKRTLAQPQTKDYVRELLQGNQFLTRSGLADFLCEELRFFDGRGQPPDFIPELPGWRDRCPFVARYGAISYFHFDLYLQCLAKIERGHAQDIDGVHPMIRNGHVQPPQLPRYFEDIEPRLYLFPAIDSNLSQLRGKRGDGLNAVSLS